MLREVLAEQQQKPAVVTHRPHVARKAGGPIPKRFQWGRCLLVIVCGTLLLGRVLENLRTATSAETPISTPAVSVPRASPTPSSPSSSVSRMSQAPVVSIRTGNRSRLLTERRRPGIPDSVVEDNNVGGLCLVWSPSLQGYTWATPQCVPARVNFFVPDPAPRARLVGNGRR
jgi:hypothetical protein